MIFSIFLKGFLVGITIAAPVGPIGILCIKKTLTHGRLAGFLTGMGAAVADTCYGAVAAFGLVLVSNLITEYTMAIRIIGGIFLLLIGIKIIRQTTTASAPPAVHITYFKDFVTTIFLTLSNPITIFAFIAIFAGLGLADIENRSLSLLMVSGVFLGSTCWWLVLSFLISIIKHRISDTNIHRINLLSGSVMIAFSVVAFASVFYKGQL
jgi:threonine/homoserine/homoserine lactone efflux protein